MTNHTPRARPFANLYAAHQHGDRRIPADYFTAAQEDRCTPREAIAIPATLRPSAARGFQTELRDISIAGFSAVSVVRMAPGTVCWLSLPGLAPQQCEVAWWADSMVGCAFTQLLSPFVLEALLARRG